MKKLALVFLVLTAVPVHAEVNRQISVTGDCLKSVFPDRGSVTVTPTFLEKTGQLASRKATQQYEALRDQVKALNLKDAALQTSEFSVQEEKEWNEKLKANVSKGFRARMGLSVSTSDLSRLGEVMAIATKLGIDEVGAFRTYLSPDLAKQTHETCLRDAVRNAREKADLMVAAAGSRTGEVISIDENPAMNTRSYNDEFAMAAADMAPAPMAKHELVSGVEVKPEEITIHVAAVFGIK